MGKTDNFFSINPFEKGNTGNTEIFVPELFPSHIKNRMARVPSRAGTASSTNSLCPKVRMRCSVRWSSGGWKFPEVPIFQILKKPGFDILDVTHMSSQRES